jgi:uncharacterized protein involved in exopolysaccharide biosynthesis
MQTPTLDPIPTSQADDDVDLQRYAQFLASYRIIIVAGAVLGAVLALALVSLRPRLFQASVTVMTVPGDPMPPGLTPTTAKAFLVTPEVASATLDELGLSRVGFAVPQFIKDSVDVQLPAGNTITVSVSLPDPAQARVAAQLLASTAIAARRRLDQKNASDARKLLEPPLAEAERDLREAEDRLLTFRTETDLETLRTEVRLSDERRAKLDDLAITLEGERARLRALEGELAPSQSGKPMPDLTRTMLERDVAESRATIARLRTEQQRTAALAADTVATKKRRDVDRLALQLNRLLTTYDERARTYNALLARYDAVRPNSTATRLQIMPQPSAPERPVPKGRLRAMALGAIGGLVLGMVAGLANDYRRRVRRGDA